MKNKANYVALLTAMTVLCACGNNADNRTSADKAADSKTEVQNEAYNVPLAVNDMDYTYEEFEFSKFVKNESWRRKVNPDDPDAWGGSSIVDYNRYKELCEELDIEVKYDDEDAAYAVLYYTSYEKLHAKLGSYTESDDTVMLYISEEVDDEFDGGTCAYILMVPVSENAKNVDYYVYEDGETHYHSMLNRVYDQMALKPVIYLYPEEETDVQVTLNEDRLDFTCTYPAYNNGWNVHALPDGTLTGENGMEYNYLYWEGKLATEWDFSAGYCVAGQDTAAFLEEKLIELGLNRKEANEFIVYWLPLMEGNDYNVISFQQEAYTDAAELNVYPAPDSTIRVFMTWYSSENYVDIPEQNIVTPQRSGFTVVEWGGTEVDG